MLVSPLEENGRLKVYIVSDKREPLQGELVLQLINLSGGILWEKTVKVSMAANQSQIFFEVETKTLLKDFDKKDLVLRADVQREKQTLSSALYYFVKPKDLKLSAPGIRSTIAPVDNGFSITLSCESSAKNVYLSANGAEGFFTDNYFDLVPGTDVTVRFVTDKEVDRFTEKLKIISLYDTIADLGSGE